MKRIIQGWRGHRPESEIRTKKWVGCYCNCTRTVELQCCISSGSPLFPCICMSPVEWGGCSDTASEQKPYLCSNNQSMSHWQVAWDSVSFGLFPAKVGLCHSFHFLSSTELSLSRSSQSLHLVEKEYWMGCACTLHISVLLDSELNCHCRTKYNNYFKGLTQYFQSAVDAKALGYIQLMAFSILRGTLGK